MYVIQEIHSNSVYIMLLSPDNVGFTTHIRTISVSLNCSPMGFQHMKALPELAWIKSAQLTIAMIKNQPKYSSTDDRVRKCGLYLQWSISHKKERNLGICHKMDVSVQ